MGIECNKLENTSELVNKDEALKNELNDAITEAVNKGNFSAEEDKHAVDVISNLRPKQLAAYITLTFKNGDTWQNYQEMCGNRFHAFMVQAVLDFLSDKYGDKKYNIKGEICPDDDTTGTYKSLDERLGEGGVDNTKGSKTTNAIKVLQNIWGIPCDGYAGPQFFVKACAELNGLGTPGNYNVNGRVNYTKKYGFNSNDQTVVIETADSGRQSINFKCPSGVNVEYDSSASVYKIIRNGAETGFTISGQSGQFTIKQPDNYSSGMGNYTINTNNEITYKGPSEVLNEKEITFLGTKFKFQDGYTFGNIEDTTDTTLYNQGKKLQVRYNGEFCCYIGANSNNEFSPHGNTERDGYNNLNLVKNADGSYTIGLKSNPAANTIGNPEEVVEQQTIEMNDNTIINNLDRLGSADYRFAIQSNGSVSYYCIKGRYIYKYNGKLDKEAAYQYDRYDEGLTRLVKNSLGVGRFGDLFDLKYSEIKDHLTDDDATLGNAAIKDWGPDNRAKVGAWLKKKFDDHSGGADFCEWCRNMQSIYHMNEDALTIRNWLAFSKMDINLTNGDQFFDKLASS